MTIATQMMPQAITEVKKNIWEVLEKKEKKRKKSFKK